MFDFSQGYSTFQALILVLPRISIMLWLLPFLDDSVFTRAIRSAVSFSLITIVLPVVIMQMPDAPLDIVALFGLFAKELMIGAFFGFSIALIFWAVSTAGFIIDMQRGAFTASLFSPVFRDQVSPIGGLFLQAMAVMFFTTGSLFACLTSIYQSYVVWPILTFFPSLSPDLGEFVTTHFQNMIYIAMLIAAPMVVVMLIIDFGMGLINKFVPQLQVFFLSMPIKGVAAVFMLIVICGSLVSFLQRHITFEMSELLAQVTRLLS